MIDTVGKLIKELQKFPENCKLVLNEEGSPYDTQVVSVDYSKYGLETKTKEVTINIE